MTTHTIYHAWDYSEVRARIVEAAETLIMNPADFGPRLVGMGLFEEYKDDYRRGERTPYRRIPSPGALARMEETWSWINTWLPEEDRKLIYDYGFIKTRKGLTLARWCEQNEWVQRTFERAVNRCCQRIADNLNRNHQIRLTTALDAVSRNVPEDEPSQVASPNCVAADPVTGMLGMMAPDGRPRYPTPEELADLTKRIERGNERRRRMEAQRRKAA